MDSDSELFERFKNGDKKAFHQLYKKYRHPIMGYVCNMTGSIELGEDVYADIWLAIIRNVKKYHGENFKALLYRSAYNGSINFIKKHHRELRFANQISQESSYTDLEPAISYEEQVRCMDKISESLNCVSKKTFELRKAGMSYEEIAIETNTSVGTVKSRIFNIVKKLKKQVNRYDLFSKK